YDVVRHTDVRFILCGNSCQLCAGVAPGKQEIPLEANHDHRSGCTIAASDITIPCHYQAHADSGTALAIFYALKS
ncbi:MAG: hypothetical protein WCA31_08460, partial [Acidimicrobiales bacterium]